MWIVPMPLFYYTEFAISYDINRETKQNKTKQNRNNDLIHI